MTTRSGRGSGDISIHELHDQLAGLKVQYRIVEQQQSSATYTGDQDIELIKLDNEMLKVRNEILIRENAWLIQETIIVAQKRIADAELNAEARRRKFEREQESAKSVAAFKTTAGKKR